MSKLNYIIVLLFLLSFIAYLVKGSNNDENPNTHNSKDDMKIYKKCNEIWSQDKLWCDGDLRANYNLCNYQSNGENFDGEHITLIATYLLNSYNKFDTRNKYCICGSECSPRHINTCMTVFRYYWRQDMNTFWKAFKFGEFQKNLKIDDPENALDKGYILVFWVKGESDLKMAYDVDDDKIKAFDTNGNKLEIDQSNVVRYDGWVPSKRDNGDRL